MNNLISNVTVVTDIIKELDGCELYPNSPTYYSHALFTSLGNKMGFSYCYSMLNINKRYAELADKEITDDEHDYLKTLENRAEEALAAYGYYYHQSGHNDFIAPSEIVSKFVEDKTDIYKNKELDYDDEDVKEWLEYNEMTKEEAEKALKKAKKKIVKIEAERVKVAQALEGQLLGNLGSAISSFVDFELSDERFLAALETIDEKAETYYDTAVEKTFDPFGQVNRKMKRVAKANKKIFRPFMEKVSKLVIETRNEIENRANDPIVADDGSPLIN